jgi:hypothetical protein
MNKGRGVLICFGLFWSALTIAFDVFTTVPAVRQIQAQRFATTPGTVLSSEVTQHDGDDGPTHGVAITYSYRVAGREYHGDRYRYGKFSSTDSGWAHQAVRAHPVGGTTTVYYDPLAPENSVLTTGLAGSDLFVALFLTPFNAVMLGFWWAGLSWLTQRGRKPVAGGVKISIGLQQTRARLTEHSPLAVGLATTALLAFLSIFVVAFGFGGFHPSLRVVSVAWGIVLSGGFLTAIWFWRTLRSGKYDLVLDEVNGTVQLPRTCGRKGLQTLPISTIFSASVATVTKQDHEGSTSYTYVPTLRLNSPAGPIEKLAEWRSEARAAGFVAWLNEKLGLRPSRYLAEADAAKATPGLSAE